MIEFTRIPVPVSHSKSEDMRELQDALLKAAAADEAIALRTPPVNEHSFRSWMSKWAKGRGYRAHMWKQRDGTWTVWLSS